MEHEGELDRAIEFLPGEEEIIERRNKGDGLAIPEMSVVLAYVKIGLFQELLEADLAKDSFLDDALVTYFPTALRERYTQAIHHHRLAAEIVSTVCEQIRDTGGPGEVVLSGGVFQNALRHDFNNYRMEKSKNQ